jgi:cytochrome c oxidase subunit I
MTTTVPTHFLPLMRKQNAYVAVVTGILGFIIFRVIATLIWRGELWHSPMSNRIITVALIGWVIGFLAGIGAFNGAFRWFLGKDLTHAEAEYMAGKDLGVKRYFRFTTDHKVVGIQYLVLVLVLFAFGGLLAMLIRTQLGLQMEIFNPNFYNSIIGTHGIAMIVAMILVITGPIGNFIVPMMIGARDMAFPRLNALSFWITFAAFPPLVVSLFLGGMRDGWSAYQPLAIQAPPGAIGYSIFIITFAVATALSSVNILVTIIRMRAKGMTWSRTPIFVYSVAGSVGLALPFFPFFMYSQLMAVSDRVLTTSLFIPERGGSVWLYEHIFWILGHPEVYVIVLPGIGALLEIMVVFLRKPLFSFRTAVVGIAGICALAGLVWAHHMFMSGWAPLANYPFMISTEMISIPLSLIVLVMIGTMWRGTVWTRLPMMIVYAVIFNKIIGGLTGIFLSDVPADMHFHGSMFVVAHFHYMLMGTGLFAAMAAIVYWFPKMTGRMFDERLGSIGFWTAFIGFQITFIGMFAAGNAGMPRRVFQYSEMFALANQISTIGAYTIGIGFLIFFAALLFSWISGEIAPANPWGAQTLEWQTETPVPLENFTTLPVVTSDPYQYGVPDPYAVKRQEETLQEPQKEPVA